MQDFQKGGSDCTYRRSLMWGSGGAAPIDADESSICHYLRVA